MNNKEQDGPPCDILSSDTGTIISQSKGVLVIGKGGDATPKLPIIPRDYLYKSPQLRFEKENRFGANKSSLDLADRMNNKIYKGSLMRPQVVLPERRQFLLDCCKVENKRDEYNSLTDKHLSSFFQNPYQQNHLKKMLLVNESGEIAEQPRSLKKKIKEEKIKQKLDEIKKKYNSLPGRREHVYHKKVNSSLRFEPSSPKKLDYQPISFSANKAHITNSIQIYRNSNVRLGRGRESDQQFNKLPLLCKRRNITPEIGNGKKRGVSGVSGVPGVSGEDLYMYGDNYTSHNTHIQSKSLNMGQMKRRKNTNLKLEPISGQDLQKVFEKCKRIIKTNLKYTHNPLNLINKNKDKHTHTHKDKDTDRDRDIDNLQ